MSKPGRSKTPTAILAKRDSWRAKINPNEPKPDIAVPRCPRWLNEKAKYFWNKMVKQLFDAGIITLLDENALARYCDTWVRWRKMAQWMDEHGEAYPVKDEKGEVKYMKAWPQVSMYHQLSHELNRLEQEFGLTPASRPNLKAEPKQEKGKSRFFNAG